MRITEMVGQRYGRFLIVGLAEKPRYVTARCDCGRTKVVFSGNVTRGKSGSCGCLSTELTVRRFLKHGHARGGSKKNSRTFAIWCGMNSRCTNPRMPCFRNYGGRGIRVCDRWRESFEAFLADMGERPSPEYSIDRVNPNGDYEPGNCRWATRLEQAQTTRRAIEKRRSS